MHENHGKGLFGFLADESEGEFNENDALVAEILKAIRYANANQESHCTIEIKGVGFESHNYPLGEEKIDIEIAKYYFSDLTIDCDKNSCATETSDFAFEKEGSFTKFKFPLHGDNKTALEILVDKEYDNKLADWLFYSPIANALSVIETYIGKTYKQETEGPPSYLRTGTSDAALEKMDCSELVCRFLKEACGLDKVELKNTESFNDMISEGGNSYLRYLSNSNKSTYTDIKPGDFFLWRTTNGGHVGVVKEYDNENDIVTVIEAIGNHGSRQEDYNPGACKGCVRVSRYTRTGEALSSHPGWKGYFRPIVK